MSSETAFFLGVGGQGAAKIFRSCRTVEVFWSRKHGAGDITGLGKEEEGVGEFLGLSRSKQNVTENLRFFPDP